MDSNFQPTLCLDGQTFLPPNTYVNPDVGGAFVAISIILINFLLPFLIKWSTEDTDVSPSIILLFGQVFPILLATLSSIGNSTLTLYDGHFTVAVTASPLAVYVASCCFLRGLGIETSLFRKLSSSSEEMRAIIMWLGIALPFLWLSVSLVTSFSTIAFSNSPLCGGMTFSIYLEFVFLSSMTGVLDVMGRRDLYDDLSKRKGLGLISLLGLSTWGIYLIRRREKIITEWRTFRNTLVPPTQVASDQAASDQAASPQVASDQTTSDQAALDQAAQNQVAQNQAESQRRRMFYPRLVEAAKRFALLRYVLLVMYVPVACWKVIIEHHPIMLAWLIVCLHWSWTLGIVDSITFNKQVISSYGQILSLFSPLPGLFSAINILRNKWEDLKKFIFKFPSFVSKGLCFILTGKDKWLAREEINKDYFEWSPRTWVIIISAWLAILGLHSAWIWTYVKAGSEPDDRIRGVNDPHMDWKIYSVSLYINGYCTSVITVFVCTSGFDYYQKRFFSPSQPSRSLTLTSYLLHTLAMTLFLITAVFLCAAPFYGPFAALPLAQQWHWDHDCDPYSTEIILTGQSNPNISSTLSFSTVLQSQPGQPAKKQHVYDFDYFSLDGYKVLQYRAGDAPTALKPEIQTVFFDSSGNHSFTGCSTVIPLQNGLNSTDPRKICADVYGTYSQDPYLLFQVNSNNTTTLVRTSQSEYTFSNDAPSFSIYFANPNSTLTDLLMISALTERNVPNVLKVCSRELARGEVLGPLGFFLDALEVFAMYIDHPSLYFL